METIQDGKHGIAEIGHGHLRQRLALLILLLLSLCTTACALGQSLAGGFAIIAGPQGEYIVFAGQFQQPLRRVTVKCVDDEQDQERCVVAGMDVFPGFVLNIGPACGWVWQPGERLVVSSPDLPGPLVVAIPPMSHPQWAGFVASARVFGAQLCAMQNAAAAPPRPFDPNADLMAPGYEPETVAGGCPYCHGSGIDPQPEAGSDYFPGSFQLEANSYCSRCNRDVISTHRHGRCPRCDGRGMVRQLR